MNRYLISYHVLNGNKNNNMYYCFETNASMKEEAICNL